ncbi:MAG: hypothetical protein Q8O37_11690 [Sulfuricellaceae bacterium]|nr:hypothetical protein [Sulfuricellaceae bacterium]
MDLVDFMINVHPDLAEGRRLELENEMGEMDGIFSAHFSPVSHHMLEVAYNPDVVSSSNIMAFVGSRGIEAGKIGL